MTSIEDTRSTQPCKRIQDTVDAGPMYF